MSPWLIASRAEIAALSASWGSGRGGWRAARRDARELLAHRHIVVDTRAMTATGTRVVLRTRLRLSGDVQTDILRSWLDATLDESVASAVVQTHFESVAAATNGWPAALAMERLLTRALTAIGALVSLSRSGLAYVKAGPLMLAHALRTDWPLQLGIALILFGILVRWILRIRLRAIFRRGLSA